MTKARTLADMISDGVIGTTELADDVITPVKLDETGNYTMAQLSVGNDTSGIVNMKGGSGTSSQIRFFDGGTGRARIGVPTGQTYLSLSGSDTLTSDVAIDASGNVGIGESSPQGRLHLKKTDTGNSPQNPAGNQLVIENGDSSGSADIQFLSATNGYNHIFFGDADDANIGVLLYDHTNNSMQFQVNTSEGMRLDANGNFLVGKTSTGSSVRGSELRDGTSGFVATFKSDGDGIAIDRSSDGELITLRVGGASNGNISGVGSNLHIGKVSGLSFQNNDVIRPVKNNVRTSEVIDLGDTGGRFKDIYLSGDIDQKTTASEILNHSFNSNRSGAGQTIGRTRYYWNGNETSRIEALTGADTANKDDGALRFLTSEAGNPIERMRIDSGGRVGIGVAPLSNYRTLTVSDGNSTAVVINGENAGLYIGTSATAGFGGNAALARAQVAGYHTGGSQVGDFVIGAEYQKDMLFATTTNSSGGLTTRLKIDQAGRVTKPYQPMCDVKLNGNTSTSGAIFTTNSVVTNNGSHWDSTNHRFIAPVTGLYQITLSAYTNFSSSYGYYAIYKNGSNTQTMHWNHGGYSAHTMMGYTRILQLSANDYIDARRSGAGSSFFDVTFITVQLVG